MPPAHARPPGGITTAGGFCSVGGWRFGSRRLAGVNHVWSGDLSRTMLKGHELNHPEGRHVVWDAADPGSLAGGPAALPKVDVLSLSPPCQGFSRRDVHDARRRLAPASLKRVKEMPRERRPSVVLIENVTGFRGSRECHHMRRLSAEMFYSWTEGELSADWMGTPMKKARVFVVLCKDGWSTDFAARCDSLKEAAHRDGGARLDGLGWTREHTYWWQPHPRDTQETCAVTVPTGPARCLRSFNVLFPDVKECVPRVKDEAKLRADCTLDMQDWLALSGLPYAALMPEDPILFGITVANLVVPDAAEVVFSSLIPPGEAGHAAAPEEHGSGMAPAIAAPKTARAEKRA